MNKYDYMLGRSFLCECLELITLAEVPRHGYLSKANKGEADKYNIWTSASVTKPKNKNARGWEEESFFLSKYSPIKIMVNNSSSNHKLKINYFRYNC